MTLQDIITFLDENAPNTLLATLGTCGNPRLRPVHSPLLYKGNLYFCTSVEKNLYKHIQSHSGVELCSLAKDGTFLRIRGKATPSDDLEAKKAMFDKFEIVKEIYKEPSNPKFAILVLSELSVRKQNLQGEFETYKA